MRIQQIRDRMASLGALPCHSQRVLRLWVNALAQDSGRRRPEHFLPLALRGTAGGIGHKNLVFSSVGDPRLFERLLQGTVKPALALSLHTTDAALRARLLPRAPRFDPAELVELGEAYARRTGYPIQYQW